MDVTELTAPGAIRLTGAQTAKVRLLRSHPMEDFYPVEARRKGLDGIVTVDLFINELGLVVEAEVLTESPKGQGFGLAALDVAKTYEFDNSLKKPVLLSMTIQFQP
ncbi:MAG: TonB family protein [Pseudomonadota bacterium]